jgi:hypothetical protein
MSHKPILETEVLPVTVRGRLDCVSFSANSCQIIDKGRIISCTFSEQLRPVVKDALGDFVEVVGEVVRQNAGEASSGKEIRLQHIHVLERNVDSNSDRKPVTAQLLRDLDLYRLGDDREDVGDAVEMVRELREQSWGERG